MEERKRRTTNQNEPIKGAIPFASQVPIVGFTLGYKLKRPLPGLLFSSSFLPLCLPFLGLSRASLEKKPLN